MRTDLLARAKDAGFTTLLITVDVPAISRRERQMRAGIGGGFGLTPSMIWQSMMRPAWSLATLAKGKPGLPTLERYQPDDLREFLAFVGSELNGTFDWNYLGQVVLNGKVDRFEGRFGPSRSV